MARTSHPHTLDQHSGDLGPRITGGSPWSAGRDESRTSGAEGGPGKRSGSNPGTAPRPDPYIIGVGRSAIDTLAERCSRSTILVHLPRIESWGKQLPVTNGPALGGYGAVAMNAGLTAALPQQLRKTLTWDRGKELSAHAQFSMDTETNVFFADPHSATPSPNTTNNSAGNAAKQIDNEPSGRPLPEARP